ncbi:MAG: glycosyltransferase [Deltaproteobacteria bacterium]|jgi:glycosyltransferase involved in cell wall biosynthesis|nr:glycosyltransferase [Deltaproteobacteria bacterium]
MNSGAPKKNLCFCNSNPAWGGGELWHLSAARHLAERGHTVFLAAAAGSALGKAAAALLEEREDLRGRLRLHDWSFRNLDFLNPFKTARFSRFLRAEKISLLLLGLPADLKGGVKAAARLPQGSVKVFYRRGIALPVKNSFLNRFFYSSLSGVIVNSRETARGILENSGQNAGLLPPEKLHIIYNGLDAAEFDRRLAGDCSAAPPPFWENPERALVLGNAGRLTAQKGQKYLLHMSAALKKLGCRHRLLLAGTGELERELKELALRLGLDSQEVRFAGFLKDMSPFWKEIDVFVLSSLWEGFGYVLAEAMLARRPICAFARNSIPELVLDGRNGFLAEPPGSEEADEEAGRRLALLLRRFYDCPELLRQMGEEGRAFCLSRFTQEESMRRLRDVLLLD